MQRNFLTANNLNFSRSINPLVHKSNYYWKIFSFKYLESFNEFIESIYSEQEKSDIGMNQQRRKKSFLKLEHKLFKFFYQDKKFSSFRKPHSSITPFKTNSPTIIKKRLVINCSKFLEFCYKQNLFSKNISEMNKIIFFYLLNFYDISNRKAYQYFNIHTILYFVMNKNIDESFKRFVVSRFLVNLDLLKYSHLLILLEEISKFYNRHSWMGRESKKNSSYPDVVNLFHPLNPFKLNKEILQNFFDSKNSNDPRINEEENFTAIDFIKTVNLNSSFFPINQKILLIENLINNLNENCFKNSTQVEILHFIKSLKIVESNYIANHQKYFKDLHKTKSLIHNLKIKSELKIKFSLKKTSQEIFCSNIPKFLNLIKEISKCGKYIDDNEIFEEIFTIIRKSSMKNESLNIVINSLFEIFIELHPDFVFKLFLQDWREKILKDENVGRIRKNVLKCVLYYEKNSDYIQIFTDYVKNLLSDNCHNLTKRNSFNSLNDLIEICFYTILIYERKVIELEEEIFVEFLKAQIEKICEFLKGNKKFSLTEESVKEIFFSMDKTNLDRENSLDRIENNYGFDFNLLASNSNQNSFEVFNFLFFICKYIERKFKNHNSRNKTWVNEVNILQDELVKFVYNSDNINNCNEISLSYNSYFEKKIKTEVKLILQELNKTNPDNSIKLAMIDEFYYFSKIFNYPNIYCEIRLLKSNSEEDSILITFNFCHFNHTNQISSVRKELKEIFIENFMSLITENNFNTEINYNDWIKISKQEKIQLIKKAIS